MNSKYCLKNDKICKGICFYINSGNIALIGLLINTFGNIENIWYYCICKRERSYLV